MSTFAAGSVTQSFRCPLRGTCFRSPGPAYVSYEACNAAVMQYRAAADPAERDARLRELYQRCLPLMRKALHRFCHPYRPASRCYPGACLPEDLVGETFPIFRDVLDEYDPSRGMDFVGFASQRLYWRLRRRAQELVRPQDTAATSAEPLPQPAQPDAEEARLLDQLLIEQLLERLSPDDAQLLRRYACGYRSDELARWAGVSPAAVRKRLERLRRQLRHLAGVAASRCKVSEPHRLLAARRLAQGGAAAGATRQSPRSCRHEEQLRDR